MDPKLFFSLPLFKDPCHVSLCPLFIFKFFKEVIHTVRGSCRPSVNKKATFPSNFVNGCLAGQAHFFNLFYFLLVALMIWSQKNRSFRKNNLPHGYQK